jgi:hypothetical protein
VELIIKLYSDKPSRIGVKYLKEYLAVKAYEELISKYPNETFSLKIELSKAKVNLFFLSEETGGRVIYKDLDYKIEQLKKLEAYISSEGGPLQFVHIYSNTNQLLIAKPFRKQTFITVTDIEVINPSYFSSVV